MNELKIAPEETKIAYYTESSNKPIMASWVPDTTDGVLQYLRGYWNAYQNAMAKDGNWGAYLHIPDYTPELVEKYIPILENRWQEYLLQKETCEK